MVLLAEVWPVSQQYGINNDAINDDKTDESNDDDNINDNSTGSLIIRS